MVVKTTMTAAPRPRNSRGRERDGRSLAAPLRRATVGSTGVGVSGGDELIRNERSRGPSRQIHSIGPASEASYPSVDADSDALVALPRPRQGRRRGGDDP